MAETAQATVTFGVLNETSDHESRVALTPDIVARLRKAGVSCLIESGATVVVIEHDLDVIRNADYIIDMGPGGGADGGRIVAAGTLDAIRAVPESVTARFL